VFEDTLHALTTSPLRLVTAFLRSGGDLQDGDDDCVCARMTHVHQESTDRILSALQQPQQSKPPLSKVGPRFEAHVCYSRRVRLLHYCLSLIGSRLEAKGLGFASSLALAVEFWPSMQALLTSLVVPGPPPSALVGERLFSGCSFAADLPVCGVLGNVNCLEDTARDVTFKLPFSTSNLANLKGLAAAGGLRGHTSADDGICGRMLGDMLLEFHSYTLHSDALDKDSSAAVGHGPSSPSHRMDLGAVPALLPAFFDSDFRTAVDTSIFGQAQRRSRRSTGRAKSHSDLTGDVALSTLLGSCHSAAGAQYPATLMYLHSRALGSDATRLPGTSDNSNHRLSGSASIAASQGQGSIEARVLDKKLAVTTSPGSSNGKIVNSFSQDLRLFMLLKLLLFVQQTKRGFQTTPPMAATMTPAEAQHTHHVTALQTVLLGEVMVSLEHCAQAADHERWNSDFNKLKNMLAVGGGGTGTNDGTCEVLAALRRPVDLFIDFANQTVVEMSAVSTSDTDVDIIAHVLRSLKRGFWHHASCQQATSEVDVETITSPSFALSTDDFNDALESFLRLQLREVPDQQQQEAPAVTKQRSGGGVSQQQSYVETTQYTQHSSSAAAGFSDDSGDDMMDDSPENSGDEKMEAASQARKTPRMEVAGHTQEEVFVSDTGASSMVLCGVVDNRPFNELFLVSAVLLLQTSPVSGSAGRRRTKKIAAFLRDLAVSEGMRGTHYGVWLSEVCCILALWHCRRCRPRDSTQKEDAFVEALVELAADSASQQFEAVLQHSMVGLHQSSPEALPLAYSLFDLISLVGDMGDALFQSREINLFEDDSEMIVRLTAFLEYCLAAGKGKANVLSRKIARTAPFRLGLLYCCEALFLSDAEVFQDLLLTVVGRGSKDRDLLLMTEVSSGIALMFVKYPEGALPIYGDVHAMLPPCLQAFETSENEQDGSQWQYNLHAADTADGPEDEPAFRAGVLSLLEIARVSQELFPVVLLHLLWIYASFQPRLRQDPVKHSWMASRAQFLLSCFRVLAASYGHRSVAAFMRPLLGNFIFRWVHDLELDMAQFPVVLCGYTSMPAFVKGNLGFVFSALVLVDDEVRMTKLQWVCRQLGNTATDGDLKELYWANKPSVATVVRQISFLSDEGVVSSRLRRSAKRANTSMKLMLRNEWDASDPRTWLRLAFRLMDSFFAKQLDNSSSPFEFTAKLFRALLFPPPPRDGAAVPAEVDRGSKLSSKKTKSAAAAAVSPEQLLAHQHGIILIHYAYRLLRVASEGGSGPGEKLCSIDPPTSFVERAFCMLKTISRELLTSGAALEQDMLLVIITTWSNCLTLDTLSDEFLCLLLDEMRCCLTASASKMGCGAAAVLLVNNTHYQAAVVRMVRMVLQLWHSKLDEVARKPSDTTGGGCKSQKAVRLAEKLVMDSIQMYETSSIDGPSPLRNVELMLPTLTGAQKACISHQPSPAAADKGLDFLFVLAQHGTQSEKVLEYPRPSFLPS
jgi:hypothetical protein